MLLNELMNERMSHKGVCRTALAIPCRLNTREILVGLVQSATLGQKRLCVVLVKY